MYGLIDKYQSARYLALGDSLAVGLGAFWGRGYTRLYYYWLVNCPKLRHLCYSNLGVIGWTSNDLLRAVTSNSNYRVAIQSAAIITLDIGGNDILKRKYSSYALSEALESYRNNLYAILYEIRCLNKHAQIYLMDIYNPYPSGHPWHEISETWVTSFNSVIWSTSLHPEFKITGIARVYDAFKRNESNYTLIRFNNIHPNTLGYKVIAECFQSTTNIQNVDYSLL